MPIPLWNPTRFQEELPISSDFSDSAWGQNAGQATLEDLTSVSVLPGSSSSHPRALAADFGVGGGEEGSLQLSVIVVCNQYDCIHLVASLVLSYPVFCSEHFVELIPFRTF